MLSRHAVTPLPLLLLLLLFPPHAGSTGSGSDGSLKHRQAKFKCGFLHLGMMLFVFLKIRNNDLRVAQVGSVEG